jgi:DNA-binding transcriptional regulator LsrR (DeoR family)
LTGLSFASCKKKMSNHRPKTHYRNMDRAKAEEIRQRYFARESNQRELADAFGVKQNTISRIVSGMVWA